MTTEGNQVPQQTNGHNHAVDGVEAEVERVRHGLRKRAREEVTPIPSIYNDALVDIATNPVENEDAGFHLWQREEFHLPGVTRTVLLIMSSATCLRFGCLLCSEGEWVVCFFGSDTGRTSYWET